MKTTFQMCSLTLLLAAIVPACDGGAVESQPFSERLQALDTDLGLGSTGEHVRALNDYLAVRGYYPNAELAAEFPAWRPVTHAPSDPSVFDEHTADAVRNLQANLGQQPTGIVDATLRDLMKLKFCGVPDNLPKFDESNKFSLNAGKEFARGHVSWRLMNNDDADLSAARTMDVLRQAFSFWSLAGSGIIFDEKTNTQAANITLSFADLGRDDWLAVTTPSSHTIKFNTRVLWRDVEGPGDLGHVAMHEIGHAIGINHSPWEDSTIFPAARASRTWNSDDLVAASALYDTYIPMDGAKAKDVARSLNDDIWIVSDVPTSGGNFKVKKWSFYAMAWLDTPDLSEGVRIAAEPDGTPWVVKANGDIFRRDDGGLGTSVWRKKSNAKATDIGVGFNREVWIADRTPVNGGFRICKFDGTNFPCSNGGGVKVSVSATGKPWIVAASGAVFRRTTNSVSSGAWEEYTSGVTGDIAVGEDHLPLAGAPPISVAWTVSTKTSTSINVRAWAEQEFVSFGGGGSDVPKAKGWVPGTAISGGSGTGGANLAIAVGGSSQPIIVSNLGVVFRSPF